MSGLDEPATADADNPKLVVRLCNGLARVAEEDKGAAVATGMDVSPTRGTASSLGRRDAIAIVATGALCLGLASCDDPKPKEQSRSSKVADKEALAALYTPDARERARQAASQYLASKGMAIRGMSAIEIDGNNYAVTADLGDGTPVVLAARQFFTEGGSRYWAAAPLDATTARLYGLALTNSRASEQNEPEPSAPEHERF